MVNIISSHMQMPMIVDNVEECPINAGGSFTEYISWSINCKKKISSYPSLAERNDDPLKIQTI